MSEQDILKILKIDLQISVSALDEYLLFLITSAKKFILKEGIALTNSQDDALLVEMYAAYLYRKRKEQQNEMPLMLRWALNNRIFSEKVAVNG